ncbi:MAG: amidohydrolase family protein [Bacillota bacterium]
MLIDFHTHVFPGAIAGKAIASLQKGLINKQGTEYPIYADGTVGGLAESMQKNGVDISVVMPVVTSAKQTDSINDFAEQITSAYNGSIISFAGIFPFQENWEAKMESIKGKGFRGIKLHPEFQQLFMDDDRAVAVLQKAEELDLCVMIHAGEDPGVSGPVYCSPERLAKALQFVKGDKIIAAHMGGWQCWDDVEKHLIGKNLLFDTSMAMDFLPAERCEKMIKAHGSKKILFGSDSPWQPPAAVHKYLQGMNLSSEELADITHKNALRLLGLAEDGLKF